MALRVGGSNRAKAVTGAPSKLRCKLVTGGFLHRCTRSVAFRAGKVEKDLGLVFRFLVDGAVGMKELVGEVAEHGGAAGGDAAFGDLDDETGEEFLDILAGREFVEFRQE